MIKEYECQNCGKILEVWDGFDNISEFCEKCGKRDMKKIISLSSFHLKGGGWASSGYSKDVKTKTK